MESRNPMGRLLGGLKQLQLPAVSHKHALNRKWAHGPKLGTGTGNVCATGSTMVFKPGPASVGVAHLLPEPQPVMKIYVYERARKGMHIGAREAAVGKDNVSSGQPQRLGGRYAHPAEQALRWV